MPHISVTISNSDGTMANTAGTVTEQTTVDLAHDLATKLLATAAVAA